MIKDKRLINAAAKAVRSRIKERLDELKENPEEKEEKSKLEGVDEKKRRGAKITAAYEIYFDEGGKSTQINGHRQLAEILGIAPSTVLQQLSKGRGAYDTYVSPFPGVKVRCHVRKLFT